MVKIRSDIRAAVLTFKYVKARLSSITISHFPPFAFSIQKSIENMLEREKDITRVCHPRGPYPSSHHLGAK